jgi:hypothetical protein
MAVKRVRKKSPTSQKITLLLGYGELKGQKGENRSGSRLESRPNSRRKWEGRGGGEGSAGGLNFEMGIVKTTEVIISREGSTWKKPKSLRLGRKRCRIWIIDEMFIMRFFLSWK